MFTSLHAIAQQATLMITIAPEGADQLRVNVTPMPFNDKAKAQLPKPLSLLATPAEFDADFIAALEAWQAPKRSLIQQAQDASAEEPAPAVSAAKPAGKNEKGGTRGRRGGKVTGAENEAGAQPAAGDATGDTPAAADQVVASAGEGGQTPAAESGAEAARPAALEGQTASAHDEPAAPAQADVSPADPVPAPEQAAAAEPVDKFTLDLF